MAIFNYTAKRGLVELVEGVIEAEDQSSALLKISRLGLFPVSVVLFTAPGLSEPLAFKPKRNQSRITSGEILNFVKKLTTLSRAQVELLSSLRILHEQADNSAFQGVILCIYNTTKEGKSFSQALEKFPKIFSRLFVSIIKAGEASGRLDVSLEQISDFMNREEGLKNKIKVALAYPTLLLMVGIASVFILLNFVVPKLKPLLESMGPEHLPVITRIVLQLSLIVNKTWIAGLVFLLVIGVISYRRNGKEAFYLFLKKMGNIIPIVNRLGKSQELTNFTQALALLLKSGIPALTSLEIALQTVEDGSMKQDLSKACRYIAGGQSISQSFKAYTKLPDFFIKMVAVGEESGRLVPVLDEIAYSYRQQIEADIAVVAALLEPLLILFLGLIMGGIVLSILLPTFEISQFIH